MSQVTPDLTTLTDEQVLAELQRRELNVLTAYTPDQLLTELQDREVNLLDNEYTKYGLDDDELIEALGERMVKLSDIRDELPAYLCDIEELDYDDLDYDELTDDQLEEIARRYLSQEKDDDGGYKIRARLVGLLEKYGHGHGSVYVAEYLTDLGWVELLRELTHHTSFTPEQVRARLTT